MERLPFKKKDCIDTVSEFDDYFDHCLRIMDTSYSSKTNVLGVK
jgi:hypothetical protein